MNFIQKNFKGILVCFLIAIPSWLIGKSFPVIGGPVIAILAGMMITCFWTEKGTAESGIKWTSKIILQTAVVLLGFGMNLGVILQTGKQSLPIIVSTISTSLIIAWLLRKVLNVPSNTSILVGVGSSICGGSAIAAITMLKEKGVNNIRFLCLLAAPEGLKALSEAHPDVDIYVGALDECLNEHGYIVQGLGDAGDRIFGTK